MDFHTGKIKYPEIARCQCPQDAFIRACAGGNIELAQWLIQNWPDIDYKANNDKVFRGACTFGNYLEIAKWLKTLPNMDVIANINDIFGLACSRGKLNVVKWLVKCWPEINACELPYLFELTALNYFDVAMWLKEKWPEMNHVEISWLIVDKLAEDINNKYNYFLKFFVGGEICILLYKSLKNGADNVTKYLIQYYELDGEQLKIFEPFGDKIEQKYIDKYQELLDDLNSRFTKTKSAN